MAKVLAEAVASSKTGNPNRRWLNIKKIWKINGLESAMGELSRIQGETVNATAGRLDLANQLFTLNLKYL